MYVLWSLRIQTFIYNTLMISNKRNLPLFIQELIWLTKFLFFIKISFNAVYQIHNRSGLFPILCDVQ